MYKMATKTMDLKFFYQGKGWGKEVEQLFEEYNLEAWWHKIATIIFKTCIDKHHSQGL